MKTEIWNGHEIRFVEVDAEWWAVAKDVSDALGYLNARDMTRNISSKDKGKHIVRTLGGTQEMLIISEFGIYDAVFNSRKPEAADFKRWIFEIIKSLRQTAGLEGFEIFRMLDKEHQREAMKRLQKGLSGKRPAAQVDYIKANTIANKAVSTRYGYPKMLKKGEMSPKMLAERQEVLDDTVRLMGINEKYGLGLSVSEQIYRAYLVEAAS